MSRRLFSNSLLRDIFNVSRDIRMLTSTHQSPAYETWTLSPLRLPDVGEPVQYLIDMGLRPALATRLSSVFMDIVARYRQVFESYFCRAIQGSCHLNPEHYCDVFVVHFRSTIQVLASRMVSTAWVWLCRTGLPPTFCWPQCMDVRVDAETKAQILLRLGFKTTSFIMDATSNMIELPDKGCNTEGDSSTKMLPVHVPPPLRSTIPTSHDLFHSKKSSTCFPACYPPPPKPISSPQVTLVTQFKLTSPVKPFSSCNVDVSSLTSLLAKMSVTTSEVGLKTQGNRKYTWTPRSKMPEPSPLVPPVATITSGLPPKPHSPSTGMVSSAKPATKPRKRRIAALPKRHIKTTALPTVEPSLPSTVNPPISRTPSLISDTSSSPDSFSSSDELDTPPSTPPSHSHVLIACNTLPTSAISSKSNTTGSFRLPMLTSAVFPDSRKGKGIHIDFTNGEVGREQQFSFTFGA